MGEIHLSYLDQFSVYTTVSLETIFCLRSMISKSVFPNDLKISSNLPYPIAQNLFGCFFPISLPKKVVGILLHNGCRLFSNIFTHFAQVVPIFFIYRKSRKHPIRLFVLNPPWSSPNLKLFGPILFEISGFERQVFF